MLDPDSFMKNSPYQLKHTDNYNLANTTHELLKFQLLEQARNEASLQQPTLSLLLDGFDASILQRSHLNKLEKEDAETRSNDSFDDSDISGISTPSSDISTPWKAVAEKDPRSYLNLKVLIENSVFDTSKMSQKAVIPLHKVKKLKQQIADKQEHKDYLTERISVSSQFCSTLLSNASSPEDELDPKILLKILKQTVNLQLELMAISQELESLTKKLNSHNMACLVLGYVEDIKMSALSAGSQYSDYTSKADTTKDTDLTHAIEMLFSHVASLAAQKNIPLPECASDPEQDSLQAKLLWTTQCIDAIAAITIPPASAGNATSEAYDPAVDNSVVRDHSFLSASPYDAYKKNDISNNKTISEYKLALNDLRFSHQYFMKEYEYLKENSLKTILEYRRKNGVLEKEINLLKNGSSASLSSSSSRDILESKDKEIAQLRREINAYKIEFLGNKSPRNSVHDALPTPDYNENETFSPSFKSLGSSMSNAILRKEFKKIVADMQDQYEIELSEERYKRRDLEEKLLKLNLD